MTQEEFIDKVIESGFKVKQDPSTLKYFIVDNIQEKILLDDNQGYQYKDYKSAIKAYVYKRSNYRDGIEGYIKKYLFIQDQVKNEQLF